MLLRTITRVNLFPPRKKQNKKKKKKKNERKVFLKNSTYHDRQDAMALSRI
jgi:hypothetical protein